MDMGALQAALEQASLASLGIGFVAGFVFSFNPVALAAIPVSLAYVTKAHEIRRAVRFGAMFIAGMVLTHVFLGAAAGLGGQWVQKPLGREWGLVLGPLLILLGLMCPGWVRLPLPVLRFPAKYAENGWGAFVLGLPFSVAVCPFCTPARLTCRAWPPASARPCSVRCCCWRSPWGVPYPSPWVRGRWAGWRGSRRCNTPRKASGSSARCC